LRGLQRDMGRGELSEHDGSIQIGREGLDGCSNVDIEQADENAVPLPADPRRCTRARVSY
jgi:hypothetical protein